MSQPLLTICIPTYNRYNKLMPMLEQLLVCPRQDFEVVVQDNCSTDGTQNIKDVIKDERLRIIKNSFNIGGIINGYDSLYGAYGKYCMFCLDKDIVRGEKLSDFLDYLNTNPSINYGICELNVIADNEAVIYSSTLENFNFFVYRCRHPSGMFWNAELFHNTNIVPRILKSHALFGFFTELVMAECATISAGGCFYRKQLIRTETPEESAKKKTLTYDVLQVFFFPKNRIFEFKVYLGQLQTLRIPEKIKTWIKVFARGFIITTTGFRSIMCDQLHLDHYGIKARNVGKLELVGIAFRYVFAVLFTSRRKAFESLFEK